jgi:predicted acylesterase/phospholipase RssA
MTSAPRVGLVLGAGGTVGAAYHAGALAVLEQDLGWDARDAAVVVGTSAGSIVGSLLRRAASAQLPDDRATDGLSRDGMQHVRPIRFAVRVAG